MAFFQSDYTKGCHPSVLSAIAQANEEELAGYGMDAHTMQAEKCVLERCALKEGAVFFVSGGTQANLSVIGSLLKPDESVLAADCGHICTQETGAIEATGHAVERLESTDGKVDAESLEEFCLSYESDDLASHLTKPTLLYISFPNENGLTYTLSELETLSRICHEHGLFLYMDGARLAYGLAAQPDVTISDIARLCDVFYIGGTKCGALCAEAIVFQERKKALRFEARLRQRGALLARGWALATQFEALFKDDLYFELGKSANEYALCLRQAFERVGIEVLSASRTNLQFVRLSDMDTAIKMANASHFGFKIVTLDGDVLNTGGAIAGGSKKAEVNNLLSREREIEEISEKVKIQQSRVNELKNAVTKYQEMRDELVREIEKQSEILHDCDVEFAQKEEILRHTQEDCENFENELEAIGQEIARLVTRKSSLEKELELFNEVNGSDLPDTKDNEDLPKNRNQYDILCAKIDHEQLFF